jgi:hypothetical protein
MKNVKNLQWQDRLALMNHYSPSIDTAAKIFSVQPQEIRVAQDLQVQGTIVASADLDVSQFASLFGDVTIKAPVKTAASLTSVVRDSSKGQPPMTATKKTTAPKKRGRKGNNIAAAFTAIPTTPTPVEAFATQYGVSIAVLRQSKRFDATGGPTVRVKKNKTTKQLEIWREVNPTA